MLKELSVGSGRLAVARAKKARCPKGTSPTLSCSDLC
jgi:hypothetical protein